MTVLVVAIAAKEGGAWRIVNEVATEAIQDPANRYVIVTVKPLDEGLGRLSSVVVDVSGALERFRFELFGIPKIIKDYNIDVVLSLGNLAVLGAAKVKQFVYIHQGLPFYPEFKWSFRKRERKILFYQGIYGKLIYISLCLTHAHAIVQTETMAKRLKKLWGLESVRWFPLKTCMPRKQDLLQAGITNTLSFFYPGGWQPYKNHEILVRAFNRACAEAPPALARRMRLVLTLDDKYRGMLEAGEGLVFVGNLTYTEVESMYRECAALVFPSYIETVGLPLVEAATRGIPILCSDCDFSKEILGGYDSVDYAKADDEPRWVSLILALAARSTNGIVRNEPYIPVLRKTSLDDLLQ